MEQLGAMSALGQKQTWQLILRMSPLPPKADIKLGKPLSLPGALPLFVTGIGDLVLLGWRRKRKVQAVA